MWKCSFQDQGVLKIETKTNRTFFFQFLMLNISSIKELLHKPEKILWNITGTLPGKLKRKISWALSYKILPPEITKTWEIGNLETSKPMWNFMVFLWFYEFLKISASIFFWLKTVLTLNKVFSLILNIFQGHHQKKHFTFRLP